MTSSFCLEINEKCHLGCPYCFATRSGQSLSLPQVADALPIIRKLSGSRIVISGGEPLLHNDLYEILLLLKRELPHIKVALSTGLGVSYETLHNSRKALDVADEILVGFESVFTDTLAERKGTTNPSLLKSNLASIAAEHHQKLRVNIVISNSVVINELAGTLGYLSFLGISKVKLFGDMRRGATYCITKRQYQHITEVISRFPALEVVGANDNWLFHREIPRESSLNLCMKNNGEILSFVELNSFEVLSAYHSKLSKYFKHLPGWKIQYHFLSLFGVNFTSSFLRFLFFSAIAWTLQYKMQDKKSLVGDLIDYCLPLYAIYVSIWINILWNHRNDVLSRYNSFLNTVYLLLFEIGEPVASKVKKMMLLLPATWERYENFVYLSEVFKAYRPLLKAGDEEQFTSALKSLGEAIDLSKTYEQYENFRYLGYKLNKASGHLYKSWFRFLQYPLDAIGMDRRILPYNLVLLLALFAAFMIQSLTAKVLIILALFIVDFLAVQNLFQIYFGFFSISKNLALKIRYNFGIRGAWE